MVSPRTWFEIGLGAALLASLLVAAVERTGRMTEKAAHADTRAEFANYKAVQAESGRHADKAERQKERDREDNNRRAAELARNQVAAAGAAADRAAVAGRKLRDALDIATRTLRACPGAAAATGSASADTAARVLADVRRRLDEAEDRTIRFADQSRVAGLACERIHDGLTRR